MDNPDQMIRIVTCSGSSSPAICLTKATMDRLSFAFWMCGEAPNAFVLPGRCVKPPSAEDSYCGNPMLLSCSAHE
jgi:hypothetical protein